MSANLTLAKNSAPVNLKIVFETPSGEVCGGETFTVKQKSEKGFKIPDGAAKASFTLVKSRKEDAPKVVVFAPSASAQ